MDSLTHTVLGACTGQVIAGNKLGKKAMLIGALVNNLPDIDMLANFWHTPAEALLTHRGITHSIVFMLVLSPLLAYLGKRWFSKTDMTYKNWLFLIAHGFVLHLGLDACTAYGTGWFEPFNAHRVSFNLLFILDPLLMLPLLIAAITLWILKAANSYRNKIAITALSLSTIYLLLSVSFKLMAHQKVLESATKQNNQDYDHFETPTALNNLLWYVVKRDAKGYQLGYYSIFDTDSSIQYTSIADQKTLLQPYLLNTDVQNLQQFSKGYYRVDSISENELQFSDVRFGQMMGCSSCDASFVFRYTISTKNGDTLVTQSKFQDAGKENLKALYNRMLGREN